MWLWCGSFGEAHFRRALSQALIFCVVFIPASFAFAEDLKVFPNQYVIEPSVKVAAAVASGGNYQANALTKAGVRVLRNLGGPQLVGPSSFTLKASTDLSTPEAVPYNRDDQFCAKLIKEGLAKSCSPNFEIRIVASSNDPQLGSLWGLSSDRGIDAPRAWDLNKGTDSQVVAIIDTGVDYNHPDLAANVWTNPGEIASNNIDDDANGYIDDVHGINAVNHTGNPFDDNGHGTHVAGTIGAVGNNSLGVVGVNWNTKIMALKFLSNTGSGSLSGAIEAINYMVTMKNRGINIRVSNNSWGGGAFSQSLFEAIQRARDAGIIFVAAAGNESNDNDANLSYPASYDLSNVVSVAAIDRDGNLASFSNYGVTQVDIAAPGVSILSTTPNGNYGSLSGTSMATPHVTGALALLLGYEPGLSVSEAIDRLYASGVPLASLSGVVRTGRTLNAGRLLYNETAPLPSPTPVPLPCSYTTEEIAYNPDTSVNGNALVQQADELNFYSLSLPFSFPFHRTQIGSLSVSPNGVLYLGNAPTTMDYTNASAAPLNALAALHTDMVSEGPGYGVRVGFAADHVTVYWKTKHYARRTGADLEVHATLYANGIIEEFINLGDSGTEQFVQTKATVGLTGSTAASAATWGYNSSRIHSSLGVRYTPNCSATGNGSDVQVSKIRLRGLVKGKEKKNVRAGKTFKATFSGTGDGVVTIKAAFDKKVCSTTANLNFSGGSAAIVGKVPSVSSIFSSLQVIASNSKASVKIENKSGRISNRSRTKISQRKFSNYCEKLFSSLRSE